MADGQLRLPFFTSSGPERKPGAEMKPETEANPAPAPTAAPLPKRSPLPEPKTGSRRALAPGAPVEDPLPLVDSLDQLAAIARGCTACRLRAGCRQVVFGEGNPKARLMFVGEGPGEQEDIQGRPFVGRAGQLLDRMIGAMGLARGDVYIANVVKCRPPGNRAPQPDEADACWPFLRRQIQLIDPKIIVCLGAVAAKRLLGPGFGVTKSRGQLFEREGRLVAVTFHPAALLRFPANKKLAWEDLKMVMQAYGDGTLG